MPRSLALLIVASRGAAEPHNNRPSLDPGFGIEAVLLGQADGHRRDEGRAVAIVEGARDRDASDNGRMSEDKHVAGFADESQ